MGTSQPFSVLQDGLRSFVLSGELDMSGVPTLEEALAPVGDGCVTVDVSGLSFLDSSGLHAILKALNSMDGGCIVLHGATGGVARVLAISGLSKIPALHVIECDVLAA